MIESIKWIEGILIATPDRWLDLSAQVPSELLTRTPAPGEWSALECLQHIIDVEGIFQTRLKAFLAGQDFPAFNPDKEGSSPSQPARQMAETFALMRKDSLQSLSRLSPDDLNRRVRHQELGMVSLYEMVHEWAAHDLNHTVQAEQALMQPFIHGSGPWKVYFTEHIAGQR